jgi:hypothetical protein
LYELLRELEAGAPPHERLEKYAALPSDFIRELGGDRLPPTARPVRKGRGEP